MSCMAIGGCISILAISSCSASAVGPHDASEAEIGPFSATKTPFPAAITRMPPVISTWHGSWFTYLAARGWGGMRLHLQVFAGDGRYVNQQHQSRLHCGAWGGGQLDLIYLTGLAGPTRTAYYLCIGKRENSRCRDSCLTGDPHPAKRGCFFIFFKNPPKEGRLHQWLAGSLFRHLSSGRDGGVSLMHAYTVHIYIWVI